MSIMAKTPSGYKKIGSAYLGERPVDKVFNANGDVVYALQRELTGVPPLLFKGKEQSELLNYRIYGDTVDGESVGDRTANLIQGSIKNANIGNNGKINPSNEFNLVYAPVVTGESYTISNNNGTNAYAFYNAVPSTKTATSYDSNRQIFSTSTITFVSPTTGYIAVRLANTAQDIMINSGSTAVPYEPYRYKVPVTVEGKNLFDEVYPGMDGSSQVTYRPLYVGDGSFTMSSNIPPFIGTMPNTANIFLLSGNVSTGGSSIDDGVYNGKAITKQSKDGYITIAYRIYFEYNPRKYKTMINAGSTPLPYEPYHAPITTPICLPEQIRKVGDEAEYIDYGEQKQHRVRKNLLQNTATSQTTYGVTLTVNSDGSATCNGTATSLIVFFYF